MYRELIEKLTEGKREANLQEPCTEEKIQKAEEYVGFTFPEELKVLLRETNGDCCFLLSAEEIINHTKLKKEILRKYLARNEFEEKVNRFIFVAANVYGDYYCYRVLENGETDTSAIYFWDHEDFEIFKVAKNISDLITKYYSEEVW